jgi:hypothetical protein
MISMNFHHFKSTISHRPGKGCLLPKHKQVSDKSIKYQQQFKHTKG